MENTLNLECHTSVIDIITPFCYDASFEFNFVDILTIKLVNCYYSLSDDSHDFTSFWSGFTALGHLVWDISGLSDDDMNV